MNFMKEIEKVMDAPAAFQTYTAATIQDRFAELGLMRTLKSINNPLLAADACQAGWMPAGCLVRRRAIEESPAFYVVKALRAAFLAWPARSLAVNCWAPDLSITELQWECVFKVEEWEEVPLEFASPLHMFLKEPCPGKPSLLSSAEGFVCCGAFLIGVGHPHAYDNALIAGRIDSNCISQD